jgi:hypothetical protein
MRGLLSVARRLPASGSLEFTCRSLSHSLSPTFVAKLSYDLTTRNPRAGLALTGCARAPGGRSCTDGPARSTLLLSGAEAASRVAFVGQRDLTVTANTYSHVMLDEAERDYERLLAAV